MEKEEKTQRSVGQAHRTPKVPLTLTGMEKRSQLRFGVGGIHSNLTYTVPSGGDKSGREMQAAKVNWRSQRRIHDLDNTGRSQCDGLRFCFAKERMDMRVDFRVHPARVRQ